MAKLNRNPKRRRKTPNPTGKGGFQKGNKLAVGNKGSAYQTNRFITMALIDKLTKAGKNGRKIDRILDALIAKALKADAWAVEFIYERVEGKVPLQAEIHHTSQLEDAVPYLNREERVVLAKAAKKALEFKPVITINQPPAAE